MKINKRILLSVILLLVLNIVYAQEEKEVIANEYKLTYNLIKDSIELNQEAEFKIDVKNLKSYSQRFRMHLLSTDWTMRTDPSSVKLSGMKVFSNSDGSFRIYLKPNEDIKLGQHEITFDVYMEGLKPQKLTLSVYVEQLSKYKQGYVPTVDIDVEVSKKVDPRKEMDLTFTLDNLNLLDIEEIRILAKSKLIDEDIKTTLSPLEKGKIVKIKKILDSKLKPQSDELIITFKVGEDTLKTFRRVFEIVDYTGPFIQKLDKKESFLKSFGTLVYTNDGNSPRQETVTLQVSFFKNLFTSTEPKAKLIKNPDSTMYYGWDLSLEPGASSAPILITTSYRLFSFVLLLFLISVFYYYFNKSPLVIRKYGITTERKEDGISEIKVTINVKNPTSKAITHLTITDYVPHIADIVNEFKIGTLRPDKILRHEKHGNTMVKWDLEALDPYEDRILTYKIRPKLSIVGDFTLPPTVIKYKKKGKLISVRSNSVSVMA